MAQANKKMPPVLQDDTCYQSWTRDLKIWKMFTDLPAAKQGPAVYLSLTGKAKDAVADVPVEDIGKDDGVNQLVAKLDEVYLKDKNTLAYLAFKAFYNFRRTAGMSIPTFVVDFEKYYNEMKRYEMKLPDGVLGFMLLTAANIPEEGERLARATVLDVGYDAMKAKLLNIFSEANTPGEATPEIKVEPNDTFYTQYRGSQSQNRGGRGAFRSGRGGRSSRGMHGGRGGRGAESQSLNPLDYQGMPRKCFICQSVHHFAHKCPYKGSDELGQNRRGDDASGEMMGVEQETPGVGQVNITLFKASDQQHLRSLVGETFGMAVLDSGCTKTVVGQVWLEEYLKTLTDTDSKRVKFGRSDECFRFGDGEKVQAVKQATFPVQIGGVDALVNAHVVENNIPLLLSRQSLKKADAVMDFSKDKVVMLGETVSLHTTKSGHYCIPLSKTIISESVEPHFTLTVSSAFEGLSANEKKAKAQKLHVQFAHATKDKLLKLVHSSGYKNTEFDAILVDVCDNCSVCEAYQKTPSRPVVGLPLSDQFNGVVCMDLVELVHCKSWMLHLIDSHTRYSVATVIHTKKDDLVVKEVYLKWIGYFGAPQKFLADNGGGFANERYKEMNEKLNVETCNTAAESPFSNGMCERHNSVLKEMVLKLIQDGVCSAEVAVAWSVSAKNSLSSHGGFSPNQLVFGFNPNLPSVLIDDLPALEPVTLSDSVYQNMNAMHKARCAFIEAEASERIRRALRHNTRTYSNVIFENGDKVFFKRKQFKGWKGPGTVLGKDGIDQAW